MKLYRHCFVFAVISFGCSVAFGQHHNPFTVTLNNGLNVPLQDLVVVFSPTKSGAFPDSDLEGGALGNVNPGSSISVTGFTTDDPASYLLLGIYATPNSSGPPTDHLVISATPKLAKEIASEGVSFGQVWSSPSEQTLINEIEAVYASNNNYHEFKPVAQFVQGVDTNLLGLSGFKQYSYQSGTLKGDLLGFSTGAVIGSFSARVAFAGAVNPTPAPAGLLVFGMNAIAIAARRRRRR